MTVCIIAAVLLGILCGRFIISPALLPFIQGSAEWFLAIMLFVVGLDLGRTGNLVRQIKALLQIGRASCRERVSTIV